VVLVRIIPLFEDDLSPVGTSLCGDEFLLVSFLPQKKYGDARWDESPTREFHSIGREMVGRTFRSPTVSSESHLIRTFLPRRSLAITSIITILMAVNTCDGTPPRPFELRATNFPTFQGKICVGQISSSATDSDRRHHHPELIMPKIRTSRTKAPPDGFDEIEPTLLEFTQRMKDGNYPTPTLLN
jgi:G10 protein